MTAGDRFVGLTIDSVTNVSQKLLLLASVDLFSWLFRSLALTILVTGLV
jgi:hypothetical protein